MGIFVTGLARSGTTWFSRVLASSPGARLVNEPDTRKNDIFANVGTRGLDYQSRLIPGAHLPRYELMWDLAFAGGWPEGRASDLAVRLARSRRLPRSGKTLALSAVARVARHRRPPGTHQIVKSVRAVLSAEWIAARYRPQVIVVWRSPLNTLASYRERGVVGAGVVRASRERFEGTPAWPPPSDDDGSVAWMLCSKLTLLLEAAQRHPEWMVVRHETLAADPIPEYRDVFSDVGLDWSASVDDFLHRSNRPGSGWETLRLASKEATAWKDRLEPEQVKAATGVIRRFADLSDIGPVFADCLAEAERPAVRRRESGRKTGVASARR